MDGWMDGYILTKIVKKSFKNSLKIVQKSSLGASWSGSGLSWVVLGAWNRLRGVLEPS
jgi:hypothetical protein